jgi:DNA-binding response OmpR family regulator
VAEPKRILVVERCEQALRRVREALERAGHDVDCVANPNAAIRAARTRLFDAVIVDLGLPYRRANRLFAKLRQLQPCVAGIAISRALDASSPNAAAAAGFQVHLGEPVNLAAVLEAMENICVTRGG